MLFMEIPNISDLLTSKIWIKIKIFKSNKMHTVKIISLSKNVLDFEKKSN
jgi:hypothetical protein